MVFKKGKEQKEQVEVVPISVESVEIEREVVRTVFDSSFGVPGR